MRSTDAAVDALTTMVEKRFRHLPVLPPSGSSPVVGILDMRACLYDAIARLERHLSHVSSAMSSALSRSGLTAAAAAGTVDSLVSKLFTPTLSEVLGEQLGAVSIASDCSVAAAAAAVRAGRGAVLVHRAGAAAAGEGGIAGIVTSKDVAFRAVAAGLDAGSAVEGIMTRRPDSMPASTTVLQALHQLQYGGYRRIPVVAEDGAPVGVLDVLQLVEAALSRQAAASHGSQGSPGGGGPCDAPGWRGFWDGAESLVGAPLYQPPTRKTLGEVGNCLPSLPSSGRDGASEPGPAPPPPSLPASLSASGSAAGSRPPPAERGCALQGSLQGSAFLFKLLDAGGAVHRIRHASPSLDELRAAAFGRLSAGPPPAGSLLLYEDEDDDRVVLSSDAELADAVQSARAAGRDRLVLHVVKRAGAAPPPPPAEADTPKPAAALSSHERVFLIGSAAVMGTIVATVGALSRAR